MKESTEHDNYNTVNDNSYKCFYSTFYQNNTETVQTERQRDRNIFRVNRRAFDSSILIQRAIDRELVSDTESLQALFLCL